jgi:prepilin-type N-terminal cleavage/methylation domain-containing protein
MSFARQNGFTILELMVALALSAGLLLAGRALTEQVASVGETIAVNASIADSARVRARWLRTTMRNMDIGSDSSSNFFGDARTAKFTSWCAEGQMPREQCAVKLTVDSVVTLTDASGAHILARSTDLGFLRYLRDSRDGGHWSRSWGPEINLPLAIGVVFRADTIVLRIGDRG